MSRNRLTNAILIAAGLGLSTSSGLAAPLSFVSAGALAPAVTSQPVSRPVTQTQTYTHAYPMLASGMTPAMSYLPGSAAGSGLASGLANGVGGSPTSMLGFLLGSMQLGAGTLGRWEDYALTELMPRIDLNLELPSAEYDFSPINEDLLMPGFARMWQLDKARYLTFGVEDTRASETHMVDSSSPALAGFDSGLNIERRFITAGLAQSFGDRNTLGITAVTAYQHFATYSAGSNTVTGIGDAANYGGRETTVGTGIRVGLASELTEGLSVGATYQTQIDMDPFNSYRGVYSDPADFDVPASAGVGIALQASSNSAITFDVQRVLYSDVNAFTSSLMPDRFLSLLGDGSSPNFAWQDLTVFSLGYQWQTSEDLRWHVNYSTRQQPLPSDEQLAQALTPGFAENNLSVGFSKLIGRSSRLNFAVGYIPDNIYTDNANGSELDQVEIEAFWVWDF